MRPNPPETIKRRVTLKGVVESKGLPYNMWSVRTLQYEDQDSVNYTVFINERFYQKIKDRHIIGHFYDVEIEYRIENVTTYTDINGNLKRHQQTGAFFNNFMVIRDELFKKEWPLNFAKIKSHILSRDASQSMQIVSRYIKDPK